MKHKLQQLPPLYVIFTLLSSIRRNIPRQNIWREFRRQGIALEPRLSFWIPLCKQAGLIKETDQQLRVTSFTSAWLNKTPEEQIPCVSLHWNETHGTNSFPARCLAKLT